MSNGTIKYKFLISVYLLFFLFPVYSQPQLNKFNFSINLFGTYVSGGELIDNIKSNNPIKRETEIDLIGSYGYGIEITYDPKIYNSGIRIALGSEYLSFKDNGLEYLLDNGTDKARIRMTEEIKFIPIEIGLKWDLPVSGETFRVYIGGGSGIYFGDRVRTISGMSTHTQNTKPGFSLNISSGLDYFINRNLSGNFEFKFRDASYDVESKYDTDVIYVNDKTFLIENPFYSRILIDGVRISLGLKYHF